MTDINELIEQLADPDDETRTAAAEELCQLGSDAQPAAVALAKGAADDNEEVREWVTSALEELGPPDVSQLNELADLLTAPGDTAYWAATLLGRLEAAAAPATATLADALQHENQSARERAAWALAQIGPPAAEALPLLQSMSVEPDTRFARLVEEAIQSVSSPE